MARQRIQLEIVGDSRSVERAFRNAGRAGSNFGRTMANLGKVAAVGFGAAMLGVGLALRRGFGELAEAQKIAAQTGAVLRSTGGIANVTANRVEKLATSLSRMSGVDDEAVASGANMLLTFTNIRNGVRKTDRIFDMATKTVLDMSVALGKDIPSTAIMVGKALNDLEVNQKGTITGWSALRRVGVKVSADMMAQAAAFIRAGKPMEAQKLLLRELNTEFGGSAAAFGTTMPGALGKLNNALDDVMAAFASGFLPLIQRVAKQLTTKLADPKFVANVERLGLVVGTKLFNAFKAISAWFQENWGSIQQGFRTAWGLAQKLANAMRQVANWFQTIAGVTPGGGETLLGVLVGGALLGKVRGLNKLLLVALTRLRLLGSTPVGGPLGGPMGGMGGKAGKASKLGKVARGAGVIALPVAGGIAAYDAHQDRAAEKAKWNALTAAQQRQALQRTGVSEDTMRKFGFEMKKLPPVKTTGGYGRMPTIRSPVLPFDPTRGQKPKSASPQSIVLKVGSRELGRVTIGAQQRAAKNTAASRRGPFAGQRLALG